MPVAPFVLTCTLLFLAAYTARGIAGWVQAIRSRRVVGEVALVIAGFGIVAAGCAIIAAAQAWHAAAPQQGEVPDWWSPAITAVILALCAVWSGHYLPERSGVEA